MTYNLFFNRHSSSAYIFNFAMACNQVYDLYFTAGIPMYEITKYVFKAYEGAFSTIPSSDGMRWVESLLGVSTMRTSPIEAVDIYPLLKEHFSSMSSEVDLNRLKSDKKLELLRESKKSTAKTLNLISELKKSSLMKSSSTPSEMAKAIYQQLDRIDLLNKMNSMKSIDDSDRELSRLSASYLIGSLLEAELILGIARSLESPISEYSATHGKVYMDWVKRNIEKAKSSFLNKADEESHLNETRGLEASGVEVFINGMESMDSNEIEMDVFKELYVKDFIKHFEHDEYVKELVREISELAQGGLRVVSMPRKDIAIEDCINVEGELKSFQEKESSKLSIDSQEERVFKNKYLEDYEAKIYAVEERKNLEGGLKSFAEGRDFYLRADGNEINISSSLGEMEVDGNEINVHATMGGLEADANESSTYKGHKELSSGSIESIVLVGRVTEAGLKLFNDNSEEIVSIRSDKGQIIARSSGDFSLERDLPGITIGQRAVVKLEVDGSETNVIKRRAQERALSSFEDDQEWVREVQSLANRIVKKSGIKGVESGLSQIQISKWTETEKPSESLNEIGSSVFASNSKVDSLVPLVKSFIEGRSSSVKRIEGARRVESGLAGVTLFKHPTQASVDRQLLSSNRRSRSPEKSQGGTFSESLVSRWVDGKSGQVSSSRLEKLLEGEMNNLSVLSGEKIVDSDDSVFLNLGEEISLSSDYLDTNGQKHAENLEMGNTQIATHEEVKFVEKTSGGFSEGLRYNGLTSDKQESARDVHLLSVEGFKQETLLEKIHQGVAKKEGLLTDEEQKGQFLSGDKQETLLEKMHQDVAKKEGLLTDEEQKGQFLSGGRQELSLEEQKGQFLSGDKQETLLEKGSNTEVTIIRQAEAGGSGAHLEPGEGDQIKEIVIKKPNSSSSEAMIAVSIAKNKKIIETGGLDLHIVSVVKAKLETKSVEIGIIKKITSVERSGVEASLVITTSGIELYKTEASVLRDISRNLEQRMIEVKVENNIMALEAQSSEIRKLKEWAAYSLIHEAMVSKPNAGREELPEEFEDAGPSGMEAREIEVDSSHNPSSLERAHEEIHRHEASTLERGSIEAAVHNPVGFDETPEEFEGQDTSSLEGSPVEADKYGPSSYEYVPSEFEGQETSDLEPGPVELSAKKLSRGSEESEEEFKDQLPSDLEKDLNEMQIKKTGGSFEEGEEEFDEQNSNDLEKDKYEMRIDTSHIKGQEEHEQEFDNVEGADVEQYSVELFITKISKIIEEGSEEFSEEYPLGVEMGSREMSFYQNELIPIEQKKTDASKGIHLRGLQSNTVDVLKSSHIKTATVSAMEADKRTKPIVGFKNRWNFFIGDAQDHIFLSPRLTKVGELVALRERCIKDLTIGPSAPTNIYKFPMSGAELRAKLRIWVHEIETPEDYVREMESIGGHLINAIKDEFEYDETSFKQTLEQVVFKYRDLFIEFFQDQLLVESTIEAKISLSAMVNFFLFYEQIIHVNMGWYSHTTVREGVSNMKRFLKGWINDEGVDLSPGSLPEKNEIPQDYIHLVRWCEWFLDAELSFSGQNYEMSAYESLVSVRDQMVHYFTTHWGIREVEYGPDGKFICSEEFSRITKVRGRKHKNPLGYNGRPQSQSMEDIYNIDLHDLLYYLKEE